MDKLIRKRVRLSKPSHFLGFGFGSGLVPFMPGTFGSLAAIPLICLLSYVNLPIYLFLTALACAGGVYICQWVSDDLGVHDHGAIVWDEIAGMLIVFIALPLTWQNLVLGFVLFRIFDILKPWPISYFDKTMKGGLGIMFDDLIAGLFAWLILFSLNTYGLTLWLQ